ncbi:hypothetical protein [Fundidesulfovibrio agrisoli]|uniref:hypothetical protein n=1 Tax=Fundidesulfovibrio agrisoli TaxID=2922717 RepID=UPI001FAC8BD0|nr:hypothetical protein [Fundidesulfovibrio agrisoli]
MNSAGEDWEEAAAEAVREASRQGRAVSAAEVLEALAARGFDVTSPDAGEKAEAALRAHAGLACFAGADGAARYHDPALLSATYAGIMDRKASPTLLMAEEIRANSREYPRPVPVELFEAEPFGLTPEQIGDALRAMAENPAFEDIAFTATSTGAVYLFSSRSLEPGYAKFLAEHAQNLAMNP